MWTAILVSAIILGMSYQNRMRRLSFQALYLWFAVIVGVMTVEQICLAAGKRVLVVVTELDYHGVKELAPLYQKIEALSWELPSQSFLLAQIYDQMSLLRNHDATADGIKEFLLRALRDSSVQNIDVIIGVHGLPGRLTFFDGAVRVKDWTQALKGAIKKELGDRAFAKLGMLYNLSCYGDSHSHDFLDLGFKVVIGSRKVNANAEIEYPWVLGQLALGDTVEEAFQMPNSQSWLRLADGPIRWLGRKQRNFLVETDSFKLIGGQGDYRILDEEDSFD